MRFDKPHMLKFLDVAIQKLQAQVGSGMCHVNKVALGIELETLIDIRDGIKEGDIPNSTGKLHRQSLREKTEDSGGIRTPGPFLETPIKTVIGPCLGNVDAIAKLERPKSWD